MLLFVYVKGKFNIAGNDYDDDDCEMTRRSWFLFCCSNFRLFFYDPDLLLLILIAALWPLALQGSAGRVCVCRCFIKISLTRLSLNALILI